MGPPLVVLKTFPLDITSARFCYPSDSWQKVPLLECCAPRCSAQPRSKTSDPALSERILMLSPDFLNYTQACRGLEGHLSVMGWWLGCVFMPLTWNIPFCTWVFLPIPLAIAATPLNVGSNPILWKIWKYEKISDPEGEHFWLHFWLRNIFRSFCQVWKFYSKNIIIWKMKPKV